MDPIRNPYSPGAGSPPPELAGRDELREQVGVAIERVRRGKSAKSLLMVGLRGVGKTVLLDRMREDAAATGVTTVRMEAPENRSLPALLAPQLRQGLIALSRRMQHADLARRALRALSGFVSALRVRYGDLEVTLDVEPESGLADTGDLEHDLQELLLAVGEAAHAASTAFVMTIDELQYVEEEHLAALIISLHRCATRQLPVLLVGAGLPQLRERTASARSYAERLFEFPEVGPLPRDAATSAIVKPAREEGVDFTPDALARIFEKTEGYPYFLQEWGKHCWDCAESSPIDLQAVEEGTRSALAALDAGFFLVRLDRLTPAQKRYMRAMAELGPGPHRSGAIAEVLERKSTSLAPTRSQLIQKGMIWSPGHGDTAFTVPLFDAFMRRTFPGHSWRE